ncbi:PREDICTED: uncharacterized protein C6orf132-like [Prunus mume]|uniref:Uncharacterized protein C6orf132-like n=1 Tax=Prunus mume TaxID=102107 RepID=A0ABM0P3W9_PRUMU|nr:PREDICTED: uncharacterized protein C6orf132-like [Prunus mume]
MASPSDSEASVPPSTPLTPQPTGPLLPPQPTLAPTAVAASPPRNPIDSFYAELNAKGYEFAEPEHPPEVEPEHPPEVAAAIKLKILIDGKDLNMAIAENAAATSKATRGPKAPKTPKTLKAPKAPKAPPMKLRILMNGKDLALSIAEAAEAAAAATATVPTPGFKKPTLPVDVNPEAEPAVVIKEMYNQMEAAAILKSPVQLQASDDSFKQKESDELMLLVEEARDAVAFTESPAAPASAIDVRNRAIVDLLHRRQLARNIFVTHNLGFPRVLHWLVSNNLINCMQWITPDAFAVNDLGGVAQLIEWGFLGRISNLSEFSLTLEVFGFVGVSQDGKVFKHKNDLFIEGRQDLLNDIRA